MDDGAENIDSEIIKPPIEVKRQRGRPRRGERVAHVPVKCRENPIRAARGRDAPSTVEAIKLLKTLFDNTEKSSKTKSLKNAITKTGTSEPKPAKSKAVRPFSKPHCVVKPMIRNVEIDRRKCEWNDCGYVADSVVALKFHVDREHLNRLTHFPCRWNGCKRREPFKALYLLCLHLRGHTGEKPHSCTVAYCNKSYARLENLKTHMRTHTGDRPYRCAYPNCTRTFNNASDRTKHQNRTHNQSKKYKCPVEECVKTYTDPSSLRKHIITVHGTVHYERAKINKQMNGEYGIVPRSFQ